MLTVDAVCQVAAALAARHIGGAVNYVAVAESTGMSASAQAAGLAADNLVRGRMHANHNMCWNFSVEGL